MGMRKRRMVPRSIGFLLIILGFLSFIGSYFLLPLYVTTYCGDSCTPLQHPTVWEVSQNVLSHFEIAPVIDLLVLLLLTLALLASVVVMGSSICFLVHPQRAFAVWIQRGSLIGSIALVLPFLLVSLFDHFVQLDIGCLGMLVGYALMWGGRYLFLIAHSEARYDP